MLTPVPKELSSNDGTTSLGYLPTLDRRWESHDSVTSCFDDMLERSIPDYRGMREACFQVGCEYVNRKRDIVDLGCSRGGAIAQLLGRFDENNRYVEVEVSPSMQEATEKRFTPQIKHGILRVLGTDLGADHPSCFPCLALCVLTLHFTPIEYREKILNRIYSQTSRRHPDSRRESARSNRPPK